MVETTISPPNTRAFNPPFPAPFFFFGPRPKRSTEFSLPATRSPIPFWGVFKRFSSPGELGVPTCLPGARPLPRCLVDFGPLHVWDPRLAPFCKMPTFFRAYSPPMIFFPFGQRCFNSPFHLLGFFSLMTRIGHFLF